MLIVFSLLLSVSTFAKDISVDLAWTPVKFEGTLAVYKQKGPAKLWETKSVSDISKAPVGEKLTGPLKLAPSAKERLVLVYQNTQDKPVYFFAAPHVAEPAEGSLGFKFKCLCVNHAFKVEAKSTWYRVVEIRIAPKMSGDILKITHSLIGLDAKAAEEYNKSAGAHAHEDM